MMKIFPMDIIAGIILVMGILQILLGFFIRKYSSRSRAVLISMLGSALVILSAVFFYFSLNNMEPGQLVTMIGCALLLVSEVLLIFLWRWRSR